jgi:hypothetical protein
LDILPDGVCATLVLYAETVGDTRLTLTVNDIHAHVTISAYSPLVFSEIF